MSVFFTQTLPEELDAVEDEDCANSCLTTTGGKTVLFVITFLDCWTVVVVEFVEELGVFPENKEQQLIKNVKKHQK